eukprot:6202472-Pleurochrysis_carterae.AAC.1
MQAAGITTRWKQRQRRGASSGDDAVQAAPTTWCKQRGDDDGVGSFATTMYNDDGGVDLSRERREVLRSGENKTA